MTTPDWQERLTLLQHINDPEPAPVQQRDPAAIPLTTAHLNQLLGTNANPFCGPTAVWWFSPGDWPFAGKPGLWRQARGLSGEFRGERG